MTELNGRTPTMTGPKAKVQPVSLGNEAPEQIAILRRWNYGVDDAVNERHCRPLLSADTDRDQLCLVAAHPLEQLGGWTSYRRRRRPSDCNLKFH